MKPFPVGPSSKFTAPRPRTGGAVSCQHSRREALLYAAIAVRLNALCDCAIAKSRRVKKQMMDNSFEGILLLRRRDISPSGRRRQDFRHEYFARARQSSYARILGALCATAQGVALYDGMTDLSSPALVAISLLNPSNQ